MTNILSKYTVIDLNRINGVRRGIYRLSEEEEGEPPRQVLGKSFTREEGIGISKGVSGSLMGNV